MNQKHEQSIYHENVNINLIVENLIQIKIGTAINVCASLNIQRNIFRTLFNIYYGESTEAATGGAL